MSSKREYMFWQKAIKSNIRKLKNLVLSKIEICDILYPLMSVSADAHSETILFLSSRRCSNHSGEDPS